MKQLAVRTVLCLYLLRHIPLADIFPRRLPVIRGFFRPPSLILPTVLHTYLITYLAYYCPHEASLNFVPLSQLENSELKLTGLKQN